MGDDLLLERQVLHKEYETILREEVQEVLVNLHMLLKEASKSLSFSLLPEQDSACKPEKFLLSSPNVNHQVKCMITLIGDSIFEADLGLKLQKQQLVPYQTRIYPEFPWKLQQIQDARNQILMALSIIENLEGSFKFTSGLRVMRILEDISNCLQLGRECLNIPKRKILEEIVKNPAVRAFKPTLPQDIALSFYVQGHKLILAVYHLYTNQMNRVDISSRYQVECVIPWLSELLLLFATTSQKCQQLKDKISLLMNCLNDFNLISSDDLSVSTLSHSNSLTPLLIDLTMDHSNHDKQLLLQMQDCPCIQNNHMMPRAEVA